MSFWQQRGFFDRWGYKQIIEQEIANEVFWEQAEITGLYMTVLGSYILFRAMKFGVRR